MSVLSEGWARQEHERIFREWLCLSLEEKHSDLEEFLDGLGATDRGEACAYERLIPPGAQFLETELFRSDLEIILELWGEGQRQEPLPHRSAAPSLFGWLQRWIPQFRSDLR